MEMHLLKLYEAPQVNILKFIFIIHLHLYQASTQKYEYFAKQQFGLVFIL